MERLLEFAVISLGAYAGCFIRVGFQYYRGAPPHFTVMYAQLLGSFVLGWIAPSQGALMGGPRLHRLLYTFVATGLCGSTTTFSTAAFESNKLALLMGDAALNYHGGRLLEWLLSLWGGFVLPLAALHGGQHFAACLEARRAGKGGGGCGDGGGDAGGGGPPPQPPQPPPPELLPAAPPAWHARAEALLLLAWAAATALVVALPVAAGWAFLAYTAAFGALGAYLRFRLAPYNKKPPTLLCCGRASAWAGADRGRFPCGTFAANMLGSWVLAAAMAAAKFGLSYHAIDAQAALYGVVTGFCGCLTTMSTFALELHTLPREAGYFYAAASVAGAQLGMALLYDSVAGPAAARLLDGAAAPAPLAPCRLFPSLCAALLDAANCSLPARAVAGCAAGGATDSLRGFQCACGALDASKRLAELLIDVQAKGNVTASMVPVLPAPADGGLLAVQPLEAFDFCLSFENLCDHALARLSCPPARRAINACSRGGLRSFTGLCACGEFDLPGAGNGVEGRVAELLIDASLLRRYDFTSLRGHPTAPRPIDFCEEQRRACGAVLEHVMCPPEARLNAPCAAAGDVATFEGACTCWGRPGPFSSRIPQAVMDSFMKPNWLPRVAALPRPAAAGGLAAPRSVDVCASFGSLCAGLLDSVACPAAARRVAACAPPAPGANASVEGFVGDCVCGDPAGPFTKLASARVKEYIVDAALAFDLEPYILIPPPTTPYWLAASSTPFKQLLAPLQPLPGSNL